VTPPVRGPDVGDANRGAVSDRVALVRPASFVPLTLTALMIACASDPPAGAEAGDTQATDTSGSGGTDPTSGVPTTSMTGTGTGTDTTGEPPALDTYGFANGCFSLRSGDAYLGANGDATAFSFGADKAGAARFVMRAADLGTYVLYDQDGGYLVAEDGPLVRQTKLDSDVTLIDDAYVSGAEWTLENSVVDGSQYQLRNRRNDLLLGSAALAAEGVPVRFEPASDCKAYPELSLDATGKVTRTMFDDGDLYGIVDTHSHVHSNYAFGGGGLFHGGAYHRLGVEHALPDCSISHGEMGRKDFFGYIFDQTGNDQPDLATLLPDLVAKELAVDNHATAGYPEFTDWPNAWGSADPPDAVLPLARAGLPRRPAPRGAARDHQLRALRLHDRRPAQPGRAATRCDDMTAVDREIDESYATSSATSTRSRADRAAAGSGSCTTPAEARTDHRRGASSRWSSASRPPTSSTASSPRAGDTTCDAARVRAQLDHYYDLGVRALFPVHKFDNAFSAGDGDRASSDRELRQQRALVELHPRLPGSAGRRLRPRRRALRRPQPAARRVRLAAPVDNSDFASALSRCSASISTICASRRWSGDYCQNAGLTPLGETLIQRDDAPRNDRGGRPPAAAVSILRAYELLQAADYPPRAATATR
jgi:hypothetical protein